MSRMARRRLAAQGVPAAASTPEPATAAPTRTAATQPRTVETAHTVHTAGTAEAATATRRSRRQRAEAMRPAPGAAASPAAPAAPLPSEPARASSSTAGGFIGRSTGPASSSATAPTVPGAAQAPATRRSRRSRAAHAAGLDASLDAALSAGTSAPGRAGHASDAGDQAGTPARPMWAAAAKPVAPAASASTAPAAAPSADPAGHIAGPPAPQTRRARRAGAAPAAGAQGGAIRPPEQSAQSAPWAAQPAATSPRPTGAHAEDVKSAEDAEDPASQVPGWRPISAVAAQGPDKAQGAEKTAAEATQGAGALEFGAPAADLKAAEATRAAAQAAQAASVAPRELRFSRELEEFRSADTLQVPEIRRMSKKARQAGAAAAARGEAFGAPRTARPARGRRPAPVRPSPGRRSASVLGRTAVLTALAVATVVAPISGQLTNAALASTGGASPTSSQATNQASARSSSVAAAVLGSDADLDEEGGDDLSNVPDAATLARIREAYQNAAQTCSSVTGASGDTSAFNSSPELFYPMLPGSYTISSEYGYRIHPTLGYLKLHAGQDLSAPVGTAIYSVAAGTVTTAGMVDGTGTVTIKHEVDGQVWYTSYLHMYEDGIYVKAGDTVTAGQLIAGVGNTGRSSGPHLHFEVRTADDTADESTVEPWGWLKEHNAVELTTNCS